MDIDQANQVADILQSDFNMYEVSIIEDYSGRGMYGETVPAFRLDSGDELFVGYVFGMLGLSEDDMPQRMDSLGRGIVLY